MANRSLLIRICGFLGIIVALAGCQPDIPTFTNPQDEALRLALLAADPGGMEAFRLPPASRPFLIPQDPRNPITPAKVELGKRLFHETGLAVHPLDSTSLLTYSCASCHHAQGGFQACLPQGIGEGGIDFGLTGETRVALASYPENQLDVQPMRSPSILNVAYQPNMLWNGQFGATHLNEGTEERWRAGTPIADNHLGFEGVETQAIAGLTVHRLGAGSDLLDIAEYRALFDAAFPETPAEQRYDRVHTGLAIAAYERTVLPTEAPFQRWLQGERDALTARQKDGAILFFGKAGCVSCHTGPALSSMAFYALGMPDLAGSRVHNVAPDDPAHRGRGGFTGNPAEDYRFKVPQLYNLKDSPFYGHGGSFRSVRAVIEYKNRAEPANPNVPDSHLAAEFIPLNLNEAEIEAITDFIENGLYDPELDRFLPTALPTGLCFPNNDPSSRQDLGCN